MEKPASVILSKSDLSKTRDNFLAVGFFKGKLDLGGDLKKFDIENENILSDYRKNGSFKGEKGEITIEVRPQPA